MRLIEVSDEPVVAVAVSHDGRLLAASTGPSVVVFEWGSGQRVLNARQRDARQLAFSPDGNWLAACGGDQLVLWRTADGVPIQPPRPPRYKLADGVGFSPDGKHLFACRLTQLATEERLERWSMPDAKLVAGFDYCPAFPRLAFSPDGQYIGGVSDRRYELRIAVTGGLNARLLMHGEVASAFTAFSPDSTRARSSGGMANCTSSKRRTGRWYTGWCRRPRRSATCRSPGRGGTWRRWTRPAG